MKRSVTIKKNKTLLLLILTTLFALFLIQQNDKPFIGVFVEDNNNNFHVIALHDLGWGWHNDIYVGDKIELIDGEHPAENNIVMDTGRIEQAETVTVNQDGESMAYQVDYDSIIKQQGLIYFLIPTLYFILCFFVSLILYKNYTSKSSFTLIQLVLLLGIGYLGSSLSLKLIPIGLMIVTITLLLAPVLFLHFVYQFMEEKGVTWFSKKILYFLYIVAMTIIFIDRFRLIQLPIKEVLLFTFVIFLLVIGWILIKGYFTKKSDEIQSTYNWIINALIIALAPYVLLYAIPHLIFGRILIRGEIAILFIFLVPVVFLYLIITGKMYLIKTHIKQFTYYVTLSTVFTLILSVFFYFIVDAEMSFSEWGLSFLLTFSIILAGFYVKNNLDRRLRTSLFVEKDYYQKSLYRFSETLKDLGNTDGILTVFKRELEDVLSAKAIVFKQINRHHRQIEIEQPYQSVVKKIERKQLRVGKVIQSRNKFTITIGETDQYYIVCFGTLSDGRRLKADEHDWLSTLAYFSSVSLENMMEIEDLLAQLKNNQSTKSNWVNRLIFNWSENERKRLAGDIHDSFLQDIIILKRKIDDGNIKNEQLMDLKQDLDDIIFSIRETCQELTPLLLSELGLSASLTELINKSNFRSNIHFSIKMDESFCEDKITLEYKQVIYRTIQELVNNAIKHSEATTASILLKLNKQHIEFIYQDDGIGMDLVSNQKSEGNMGLVGMKERIHSFNGRIRFESEQGLGLKVTAEIPIIDV